MASEIRITKDLESKCWQWKHTAMSELISYLKLRMPISDEMLQDIRTELQKCDKEGFRMLLKDLKDYDKPQRWPPLLQRISISPSSIHALWNYIFDLGRKDIADRLFKTCVDIGLKFLEASKHHDVDRTLAQKRMRIERIIRVTQGRQPTIAPSGALVYTRPLPTSKRSIIIELEKKIKQLEERDAEREKEEKRKQADSNQLKTESKTEETEAAPEEAVGFREENKGCETYATSITENRRRSPNFLTFEEPTDRGKESARGGSISEEVNSEVSDSNNSIPLDQNDGNEEIKTANENVLTHTLQSVPLPTKIPEKKLVDREITCDIEEFNDEELLFLRKQVTHYQGIIETIRLQIGTMRDAVEQIKKGPDEDTNKFNTTNPDILLDDINEQLQNLEVQIGETEKHYAHITNQTTEVERLHKEIKKLKAEKRAITKEKDVLTERLRKEQLEHRNAVEKYARAAEKHEENIIRHEKKITILNKMHKRDIKKIHSEYAMAFNKMAQQLKLSKEGEALLDPDNLEECQNLDDSESCTSGVESDSEVTTPTPDQESVAHSKTEWRHVKKSAKAGHHDRLPSVPSARHSSCFSTHGSFPLDQSSEKQGTVFKSEQEAWRGDFQQEITPEITPLRLEALGEERESFETNQLQPGSSASASSRRNKKTDKYTPAFQMYPTQHEDDCDAHSTGHAKGRPRSSHGACAADIELECSDAFHQSEVADHVLLYDQDELNFKDAIERIGMTRKTKGTLRKSQMDESDTQNGH